MCFSHASTLMPNAKLTHSRLVTAFAANRTLESPRPSETDGAGGCWVERLVRISYYSFVACECRGSRCHQVNPTNE
jgi:hypothetical protein